MVRWVSQETVGPEAMPRPGLLAERGLPPTRHDPVVAVRRSAWDALRRHAAASPVEVGGVLVGRVFADPADGRLLVDVEAALPAAGALGTPTYFRFTPEAWDAVGLAVQIVRSTNGRLTLLTVVVPAPAWTQVGLFAVPEDGSAERAAEKRLRELVDAIPDDLPVTSQLLHGDAAHLIAQRAEEGNHDLVVLAAHEHGPIAAAIESVQRRLLRHTSVPVLAIRRPLNDDELAAEEEREPDPPA